jgi:hypothetical protein
MAGANSPTRKSPLVAIDWIEIEKHLRTGGSSEGSRPEIMDFARPGVKMGEPHPLRHVFQVRLQTDAEVALARIDVERKPES